MDYKEEINHIYQLSLKDSIVDNTKKRLMETFYKYFTTYNIENVCIETEYIFALAEAIDKTVDCYPNRQNKDVDFFNYCLYAIKNAIKKAKGEENETVHVPINQQDLKIVYLNATQNNIDIKKGKFDDKEIDTLSQYTGFDNDKITKILHKLYLQTTEKFIIQTEDDDGEQDEYENENFKHNSDTYDIDKQVTRKKLSLINDLYSIYCRKKQNRKILNLKVVLTNNYIKILNDGDISVEQIEIILKQFKFYDLTDNNVLNVIKHFKQTNKVYTQQELAKLLNVNGAPYINRIQKEFEDNLQTLLPKIDESIDIPQLIEDLIK